MPSYKIGNLHSYILVPEQGIRVEVSSRVKPQINALLAVSLSLCEYVGLEDDGFACLVAEKLKIHLIMLPSF